MTEQEYTYHGHTYTIEFNGDEYRFTMSNGFWSGWTDEQNAHKLAKEYIHVHYE